MSADGASWGKVAARPGFAGARMTSIAVADGSLVAVGYDGNGALAWTSGDGRTWSQSTSPPTMASAQALGVASGSTVTIVVGTRTSSAAAWSSGR